MGVSLPPPSPAASLRGCHVATEPVVTESPCCLLRDGAWPAVWAAGVASLATGTGLRPDSVGPRAAALVLYTFIHR